MRILTIMALSLEIDGIFKNEEIPKKSINDLLKDAMSELVE